MSTTAERLRIALSLRNMKQSELAERTGIGKSSISTYLSGAYLPKQRNIYKIAQVLDVSEAWLMGLDVSMERVPLEPLVEHVSQSMETVEKAQRIAVTLAGATEFDTAVLTHPNVVRLLDSAADATQEELLDAVDYLEFQKTKR